ncbi:MAG: AAA family ATPase [Oscillospiraceae bacterium]|nr:AAA family ATPase [Oscillospiraceae bacterium]
MGLYLNPGNRAFQMMTRSKIYIDKSKLIALTNAVINTEDRFICVSRPRRFGKSVAANMLVAYYSRGCDSSKLFSPLEISKDADYTQHLNRYHVIHLNMTEFMTHSDSMCEILDHLSKRLLHELKKVFGDVECYDWTDLISVLKEVFEEKQVPFVFIIDEWDCVFREHKDDAAAQKDYLDFLRDLLKNQNYVALTYMTGILPIKKYGKHSALNMFTEISMTDVREYAEFTGFTEGEVKALCEQYNMPFEETKRWYDGYELRGVSVYNPRSVVMSMTGGYFSNYWTSTETYEALKVYIEMNFDGLREKIIRMIAGESVKINTGKFQNDMTTFNSADDVLTLPVHLGYLSYDFNNAEVRIPNSEVQQEFINSIEDGGWESVMDSINQSEKLLNATIAGDAETVASAIELVHQENTSILKYNDENALACVISLAYYSARRKYRMVRELPTGKGFADIVLIPFKNTESPAIVIELKYEKSAETAIDQIKRKDYCDALQGFSGEILLVGISYDGEKKHSCVIERVKK